MKQCFDLTRKLFDRKDEVEKFISVYPNLDSYTQLNFQLIAGYNPIIRLNEINQALASQFNIIEGCIKDLQNNIAKNTPIINRNRDLLAYRKSQITNINNLGAKEEESKLKETQVKFEKETSYNQELKQKFSAVQLTNKNLMQDISLKQVSFLLQKALEQNDVELFGLLGNSNFDVNFQNVNGEALLHTAIKYKHETLREALLDSKQKEWRSNILTKLPNTRSQDEDDNTVIYLSNGETLLYGTIKAKYEALLNNVITKSPNTNLQDKDGNTVLHFAIKAKDFTLAKKLVTNESNLNLPNKDNITVNQMLEDYLDNPLHASRDLFDLLGYRQDSLYEAIEVGNIDEVKYLLNDSPMKNTINLNALYNGYTPLHYAILYSIRSDQYSGNIVWKGAIVKYLLEECPRKAEFDITTKDKNGWNALHHASCSGSVPILKFLFEQCSQKHKADINAKDDFNRTVFELSANVSTCVYLLEDCVQRNNININDVNNYGETRVHKAMKHGETRILQYLLTEYPQKHLINLNTKNNDGETPLHLGARFGNNAAIKVLLEGHSRASEVDIKAKTNYGKTALALASSQSIKDYLAPKFTVMCATIEYDNPVLNHPELMTKITKKFGINVTVKLINFGMQFTDTQESMDALETACAGQDSFENIICLLGLDHAQI